MGLSNGTNLTATSSSLILKASYSGLSYTSGPDPGATAFFAAVVAAGGTVSPGRQAIYNTLFSNLRGAGLLNVLDRLWLFAAENTQSALTDLIALSAATPIAAPTFTVDRGYAGDGATSYILSNYVPNAGVHLTQNSAHLSVYNQVNDAVNGVTCGALADPAFDMYCPLTNTGQFYSRINEADTSANFNAGNTTGYYIGDRTGVGAVVGAKNGSDLATNSTASTGVSAVNIPVLALNNFGAIQGFSTGRVAALSMGSSLGSGGRSSLASIVNAYMTSVGANVY